MLWNLELLSKNHDNYIARGWEEDLQPIGEIDPETSQPFKPFDHCIVISVDPQTASGEIKALIKVPPKDGLTALRQIALQLKLTSLYGVRWINKIKRRMNIRL